jgi:serine protease Do
VALLAGSSIAREIVSNSHADLIRELIPSVVNITTRIEVASAPDPAQASVNRSGPLNSARAAFGSGFVIDSSGLIATNWHVVADAFEIIVTFSDGTRLPAKVIGAWRVVDLALLRVDAGHPCRRSSGAIAARCRSVIPCWRWATHLA